MKILVKEQKSQLDNSCIRWYLSEEKLWITMLREYEEVENSIRDSIGSFNWLYEVNDTILFRKEDGRFETAIIDLSGKINLNIIDSSFMGKYDIQKGNLFFAEKTNVNFEFPQSINYIENKNCLISLPDMLNIENLLVLFILDDFGFIVINNQLSGWILKNASKYIYITGIQKTVYLNNHHLLGDYFRALNIWEKDNDNIIALKELLEIVEMKKDIISVAIKECIMNII